MLISSGEISYLWEDRYRNQLSQKFPGNWAPLPALCCLSKQNQPQIFFPKKNSTLSFRYQSPAGIRRQRLLNYWENCLGWLKTALLLRFSTLIFAVIQFFSSRAIQAIAEVQTSYPAIGFEDVERRSIQTVIVHSITVNKHYLMSTAWTLLR